MDKREGKVEGFRITPQQRSWSRAWKRHRQIMNLLEGATLQHQAKSRALQGIWQELQRSHLALRHAQPRKEVFELEGMDFPEESREPEGVGFSNPIQNMNRGRVG